jgi:hypothetical protein
MAIYLGREMAVLTAENAQTITELGNADLVAFIALRNVTVGDTLDIATVTNPAFQVVKSGVVMGVSDFVEIAAAFIGTVVTMPAGLDHSSAYITVLGC